MPSYISVAACHGFACSNGWQCTSSIRDRCDGRVECDDGSDEVNCGTDLISFDNNHGECLPHFSLMGVSCYHLQDQP